MGSTVHMGGPTRSVRLSGFYVAVHVRKKSLRLGVVDNSGRLSRTHGEEMQPSGFWETSIVDPIRSFVRDVPSPDAVGISLASIAAQGRRRELLTQMIERAIGLPTVVVGEDTAVSQRKKRFGLPPRLDGNSRLVGAAAAAMGSVAKGRKVSASEVSKTPPDFGKVYLAEIEGELFQVLAVANVPSGSATAVADDISYALARDFRLLTTSAIYLSEAYCVSPEGESRPLALVRPANGMVLYNKLDLPHFAEHINALESSAIEQVFTSLARKWHLVLLDQLDPPKAAQLFRFIVFSFSSILQYLDIGAKATSSAAMKRVVRKVMPAMLEDEEWLLRFLGYATPAKLEEWLFRDLSVSRPADAEVMQRLREVLPRMTVAHTVFSGLEFEEVKTALLAHLLATSRE